MSTTISITGDFDIPLVVPMPPMSFDAFCDWVHSPDFPQSGRIDFINGSVEIDMSPEKGISHNLPKLQLIYAIATRAEKHDLGRVFFDRMRIRLAPVAVNVEPDLIFVTHDSLLSGKVKTPASKSDPADFVEIVGAPDIAVEVVSDSSVKKDWHDLMKSYYKAGVDEYWITDARGSELVFVIHRRGSAGYEPVEADADGYASSLVLGCDFRMRRDRDRHGWWKYQVDERPTKSPA